MAKYTLIASRDPFAYATVSGFYDLAEQLAAAGNDVTLFLVQNGVLPVRASAASQRLTDLSNKGVDVRADDFSLKERGISDLIPGVSASPLDVIIDQLEEGRKALWH